MELDRGLGFMRDGLHRVALDLGLLDGWRRWAAAFFAGALSVLALAPVHILPVLFLTFPILVWLLDGLTRPGTHLTRRQLIRASAAIGWWFGFGYFLFGLYWIGFAFMVEAEKFALLMPFAVVVLPAGLALFVAGATMLARLFWFEGYARLVVLALSWVMFEWLRGHIFTGFPWNLIGESLVSSLYLMQWSALIGPYGLSFVTVLAMSAPAAFDLRQDHSADLWSQWRAPATAFLCLALMWGGGLARIALAAPETEPDAETSILRLVQPNVPQTMKWKPESRMAVLGEFLRLSSQPSETLPTGLTAKSIVIWPESALSIFLAREPFVLSGISRILPDGATLMTGSVRGEPAPEGPPDRLQYFYNSFYTVNSDGQIVATYDKSHLVPFGEYLPYHRWLEKIGLRKLTQIQGSFDEGPGPQTLTVADVPSFSPLICYEIIFPGNVISPRERPYWIVNVTNDAWFGPSSGPYQHLDQARLRAVEQGLPVARSANTGVSALIDPYGRIVASLPLNSEGIIDVALPPRLEPTPYARFGDWILAVLLMLSAAGVALLQRR
ncbi:MAG: apolipoprotein N-acyltransferase [Parvibaculum sp.]|nr:apolipoprotein N-acyltransferase [Parvibaculum sp.]